MKLIFIDSIVQIQGKVPVFGKRTLRLCCICAYFASKDSREIDHITANISGHAVTSSVCRRQYLESTIHLILKT